MVRKKTTKKVAVETYKHKSSKRKNIPTAKMAGEGRVPGIGKARYSYSAHLSPELRFDSSGRSDRVTEVIEKAVERKNLTAEEAEILRGLGKNASQPWLEWSAKKEDHDRGAFGVSPVALHIHERVSANAIIRTAKREDVQADLFADTQQTYREAIQFYQHDVDWANRIILGDSLDVMASLARREKLAGKIQMIYMDPPYGIKFKSNFQSEIGKKDVKDSDSDLNREPEMIKAYRDTWKLGTHSYLSYLRDRLIVCRELLQDTGSIFLQIGDENQHRVRCVLDEVFGPENFVALIPFRKKSMPLGATFLEGMDDFLLWYARDKTRASYKQLYRQQDIEGIYFWSQVELPNGARRRMKKNELNNHASLPAGSSVAQTVSIKPPTFSAKSVFPVELNGKTYRPSTGCWIVNEAGMGRLISAERLVPSGSTPRYFYKHSDFPYAKVTANWFDMGSGNFTDRKIYTVQTASKVIERCMLMTTKPGDLVLDPTGGSGTTAYVAEQHGRRWILIDTGRVAVSLSRQRLLTAKYEYYKLYDENKGVSKGFVYRTAPRINIRTIAGNVELDPIFDRHGAILDTCLSACNQALSYVSGEIRADLVSKLAFLLQEKGTRGATDEECRRWLLPGTTRTEINEAFRSKPKLKGKHVDDFASKVPSGDKFDHWEVPFNTDEKWPVELSTAVTNYRKAWREKTEEVDSCIAGNAEQETMVDMPEVVRDVVRVSGPFTVEGVRPEELSLDENGVVFDPTPNEWEVNDDAGDYSQNASAYIDRMIHLVEEDGITFPNNEHRDFTRVDRLEDTDSTLHAEALWSGDDESQPCNIAIAFGPQYGPVTAEQVEDLVRASRRYDELVVAGFSFDAAAQAVIQESVNPRLRIHMAHIRPDASPGMDGLLKDSPKSQLFTVFGQPEIEVRPANGLEKSEVVVELLGVDIYSPLTGEIASSGADKVAAWFLDTDYDGRCFCITQAFFPDQKAWDKIIKALSSSDDVEAFAAYNGTVSVPFEPGEHKRIAVKVIDPRGNEVMAIRSLREHN